MLRLRLYLALLLPLALGACGFRPLYGDHGAVGRTQAQLETIAIEPIDTKLGVMMRNNLLDRLTPGGVPGDPRYALKMAFNEKTIGIGVLLDASVTRFNYLLTTDYQLFDKKTHELVFTGSSRSQVGYDVVQSQFATVIARQDAKKRAVLDVSEDITLRLALFFATGPFSTDDRHPKPDTRRRRIEPANPEAGEDSAIRDTL